MKDSRAVLLTQINNLAQQLSRVGKSIQSERLDKALRQRVEVRFEKLLAQNKQELDNLRSEVTNGQPLQHCWTRYSQVEQECRKTFDESLAFIQGALARADSVDDGMCRLADDLLDELSTLADAGWRRFTLLATGEFYLDTAELIRIRYPEVSLWGLPAAAHEFGHYLGPELWEKIDGGKTYPFQELLRQADQKKPANWPLDHATEWHHLHEHFADLFATYTLGPAFACCFILLRINPAEAIRESATHPTHLARVHSILWLLDQMDNEAGALMQPFRSMIEILQKLWRQGLTEAGLPDSLPPARLALLNNTLKELLDILKRTTAPGLAYRLENWQKTQELTALLLAESWPAGHPTAYSRRDVLNAAWYARLMIEQDNHWVVNLSDIGSRARQLYAAAASGAGG